MPIILKDHLTGLLVIWRSGADKEFKDSDLNFLGDLAQQAAIAIENARLYEAEQLRRQEAEKLRLAATTIASSLNLKEILDILLKAMKDVVPYDSASIFLAEGDHVRVVAAQGLPNLDNALNELYPANNELLKYLRENNMPLILEDAQMDVRFERWSAADFVRGWMGIPLVARGQILGYITLDSFTPAAFNIDMTDLAQSFAHQAATAIENAQLFENLQKSNLELSQAYDTTLEGWGKALELRDKETQGHTMRVTDLTLKLARKIGIQEPQLTHLRRGVLMHDIGKMGVTDRILHKKAPLTKREWSAMREHPQYAYDLLFPITYLRPALDIAYCHHERWDGTGYPRGLKNVEIPLGARIFSVVDVWDALMSDRSYRGAWPRKKVMSHIRKQSGLHFDPQIVEVFLDMMEQENDNNETGDKPYSKIT
jgi:HD-GYP domain-containing protein (c-di-GMP phosphodiesterase class II)